MKQPPSVCAYAPTRPLKSHPQVSFPDPRLKPGPVFVASGGVIKGAQGALQGRQGLWQYVRARFSGSASAAILNDVYTFIARSLAVSYVGRYDDSSSKEALGIFRSRIRRVRVHAAIFAWSDLILDRSRRLSGLKPAFARHLAAPSARVATLVITLRTAPSSTPSPRNAAIHVKASYAQAPVQSPPKHRALLPARSAQIKVHTQKRSWTGLGSRAGVFVTSARGVAWRSATRGALMCKKKLLVT